MTAPPPAGRLPPQPWMTAPATQAVIAALVAAGATPRFVGGCVRNAVLRRPITDVDIATPTPPDAVMALLDRAGIRAVPTGLSHGTVTAVVAGTHFEITTLRRDVATDGRHAEVAFTDDWAADAARRDFTMNALYCDPAGTMFDPTGGLADLRAGRVRFIGDAAARIREDYLRILRFFRFLAWYGRAAPDRDDLLACTALAHGMARLAAERIAGETLRLLAAPAPAMWLELMRDVGVLREVLADPAPQPAGFARLATLCRIERSMRTVEPVRRLAALLPDDPAAARALAQRLRLSNAETDRLAAALDAGVLDRARPMDDALRVALYRHGRTAVLDRLYLLAAVRPRSAGAGLGETRALLRRARTLRLRSLPVQGRDVLALGVPPGAAVGRLLAEVEAWWLARGLRPTAPQVRAELRRRVAAGAG